MIAEECGVVERSWRVGVRAPLQQQLGQLWMVGQPSRRVQRRAVAEHGDSSNGRVRVGAGVEQRLGHLDQSRLSGRFDLVPARVARHQQWRPPRLRIGQHGKRRVSGQ